MIYSKKKKSISLLLGAGFSIPMGYPTAKDLSSFAEMITFTDAGIPYSVNDSSEYLNTEYQRQYEICKKLIDYYKESTKDFYYEEFYDFLKTEAKSDKKCRDIVLEYAKSKLLPDPKNEVNILLNHIEYVYSRMIFFFLKDGAGEQWYENITNIDAPKYKGLLEFLHEKIENGYIIHVHTLNHDLFFESLNQNNLIRNQISDGFDEFGSEYYGELQSNFNYHCRLERYTGHYRTSIRLYKLHGSINYVLCHEDIQNGASSHQFIKMKKELNPTVCFRGYGSKKHYKTLAIPCFEDFLTGTQSKQEQYNHPFYRTIHSLFRKNLRNSESLFIIGYSGGDKGINEMIQENVTNQNKLVCIINPSVNEDLNKLFHAKWLECGVEKLTKDMLNQILNKE